MLNKLRLNDSRKTTPIDAKTSAATSNAHPLDQYTSSTDIRKISIKKDPDLKTESDASSARDRLSASELYTPATEVFDESAKGATAEMEQVKRELEAAKSVINQQKRELEESRTFKHTMEQALPSPSEAEFPRGEAHISSMHRYVNCQVCGILLTRHLVHSMPQLDLSLVGTGLLGITRPSTFRRPYRTLPEEVLLTQWTNPPIWAVTRSTHQEAFELEILTTIPCCTARVLQVMMIYEARLLNELSPVAQSARCLPQSPIPSAKYIKEDLILDVHSSTVLITLLLQISAPLAPE